MSLKILLMKDSLKFTYHLLCVVIIRLLKILFNFLVYFKHSVVQKYFNGTLCCVIFQTQCFLQVYITSIPPFFVKDLQT